jgi:hypothetical protein
VPFVLLQVDASASLPAIATLTTTVSPMGLAKRSFSVALGRPNTWPRTLSIQLPTGTRGLLHVEVDALTPTGATAAVAMGSVDITANQTFPLEVALGGGGGDLGATDATGCGMVAERGPASVADSVTSTATSITLPNPQNTHAGDLLLLSLYIDGNATQLTNTPSGWTLIHDIADTAGSAHTFYYYRVASNNEPTSYMWTYSTPRYAAGLVLALFGQDADAPLSTQQEYQTIGAPPYTLSGLSITRPNSMVITTLTNNNSSGSAVCTSGPSGMTKRGDTGEISVWDGVFAAGPTGSLTINGCTPAGPVAMGALAIVPSCP